MLPSTKLPQPQRLAWIRAMLPPIVAAIVLIFALKEWIEWGSSFVDPVRPSVFRIDGDAWQQMPELPGRVEALQVSGAGRLWALYWRHSHGHELARLEDGGWRIFNAKDFGSKELDLSGGFVLDGDRIWAAGSDGVLHFDGANWKLDAAAKSAASPNSIVAANGQAWVIDDELNLSHYDGRVWTSHKPELAGAAPDEEESPELARTADGTLWIVRNGLWRSTGDSWTPVVRDGRPLEAAFLAGSTGARVWLWAQGALVGFGPDGTVEEFAPDQMGLARDETGYDLIPSASGLYVATTRGVLALDGSTWRRLPPPPSEVHGVYAIRAGSGRLFGIGSSPHPLGPKVRFLVPVVALLLSLAMLALPVWTVRRYKKHQLLQHQALQQAVVHATGAVPDEFVRDERILSRQSSWWSATVAVGVILGASVAFFIVQLYWRNVPSWMFLVIALGLHVVITMSGTLVKRTPRPWDPIEPGGPGFDWGPTRSALPGALAVFLLMNLGAFPKWMGSPVSWLVYAGLAVMWYKLIEQKLVVGAIKRGDYEGALKIARRFRFYNPESGEALASRGQVLLLSARFHEAEQALRRAIARLRSRLAQGHALEFLGDALLEQGRYEDAVRAYEAALHTVPGFRRPYRGLAESVLRRGHDPARALEYIENIFGPSGPSRRNSRINGRAADDYWSLKAWALAEAGRGAEVPTAIEQAIQATNRKSRPDVAATYRRLGLAMQALGREKDARSYLKTAAEADPGGRWSLGASAAFCARR